MPTADMVFVGRVAKVSLLTTSGVLKYNLAYSELN